MTATSEPSQPVVSDALHSRLSHDVKSRCADIARAGGVDFEGYSISTAVLAFNEWGHKAFGAGRFRHNMETWPPAVKASLRSELDKFSERNCGAKVVAVTQAITGDPRSFVMALHWRPKS